MNVEELAKLLATYQVIMFDLDDTLYNQDDYDFLAFVDVAEQVLGFGEDAAKALALRLLREKRLKPKGYRRLFDNVLEWLNMHHHDINRLVAVYHRHDARGLSPERSLHSFVRQLRDEGRAIYIVTNGRHDTQMRKIAMLGLEDVVNGLHIGDPTEPNCPIKPSREVYAVIKEKYGCTPSVMVGDDAVDEAFAHAVGLPYVGFVYR